MRSHPYAPPPVLPPIFDELATYLPNQARRHSDDALSDTASGIALRELDPETSHLLPPPPRPTKRVHVRVQGRLALVQSVSTVDLRQTARRDAWLGDPGVGSLAIPSTRRGEGYTGDSSASMVSRTAVDSGSPGLSPGSFGSAPPDWSGSETEEERETALRDRQLRGYGIGGAGNIRRPTEVVQFPSRRISSMTLFSTVSSLGVTSPVGNGPDKKRWNIRDLLGRRVDRKRKGRADDPPT